MDYSMARFTDLYTIRISGTTLEMADLAEAFPHVPVLPIEQVAEAVAKVSRRVVEIPYEALPKPEYKEYMNGKEVCKVFPMLAYNNVKSRQWRLQNAFPTVQLGGRKSHVKFSYTDVKEWVNSHSS